ncbi:MAG: CopD family protein [Deferrisomatales bacterium]|nr:CopD family protein [Deferrisomatales bacterium]
MRRWILPLPLVLCLLAASLVGATDEYADSSAQECATCHLDPDGGGPLTYLGEAYAAHAYRWPLADEQAPPAAWRRPLRILLGLTHFLAAIAWFGTIFYVHIVLRPHYAKGGLPRTEMRIAWACMALLALTGIPLTLLRFGSLGAVTASPAGNLLLVKIGLYLFLVVAAAFVTRVLSPKLKQLRSDWQRHDGREGREAWVKVGDQLYDLTGSPRWQEGNHFGRHQAGEDLTAALQSAPHGPEKLAAFPEFSLVGGTLKRESTEVRVLFVMAYLNLAVAVGVVVVIAWWRWG